MTDPDASGGFIDVHTHVVPHDFPTLPGADLPQAWPSMAPAHACHRHVMVSGKVYRTVSHQCWDCKVRAQDMQRMGAARQVLSPMPELLSYWLPSGAGQVLARYLNDWIADLAAQDPKRFTGLGTVPLQDLDMAIRELHHAVHDLGLAGVEIGTHVNGCVVGDPRFLPFFQAAADWGAAVFVHPLRPVGMDRLVGHPALEQVLAFPGETGLAAASFLTGGTLARLPHLRIAFSHGGGSMPVLLPRLQHAWDAIPAVRESIELHPTKAARTLFYDGLVYDEAALRRLVEVFGAEQIMLGTDYPFPIQETDPLGRLHAAGLDPSDGPKLLRDNARRWLGVS